MRTHWGAWLAVQLLRGGKLSIEDRQLLTSCMLDRLGALPVRATITFDETGKCLVRGKELPFEKARLLKLGAQQMLRNYARRFVQENMQFLAIKQGVHQNLSPEQGLFAKAILWQHQEEQELYERLAQDGTDEE